MLESCLGQISAVPCCLGSIPRINATSCPASTRTVSTRLVMLWTVTSTPRGASDKPPITRADSNSPQAPRRPRNGLEIACSEAMADLPNVSDAEPRAPLRRSPDPASCWPATLPEDQALVSGARPTLVPPRGPTNHQKNAPPTTAAARCGGAGPQNHSRSAVTTTMATHSLVMVSISANATGQANVSDAEPRAACEGLRCPRRPRGSPAPASS